MSQTNGYILLVEDSDEDVEMILRSLKRAHVANQVTRMADGVEALDFLLRQGAYAERKGGHPMLILMDVKMPRMDGIEALAAIRRNESLKAIPVVMLTSSRHDEDILKSYNIGANAYVIKPVEFDGFAKAIEAISLFWIVTNQPPL